MGREYRLLRRSDLRQIADAPDPETAWIQAALRLLGAFGAGCWEDGTIVAYALIAPASHVPHDHPLHRVADPAYASLLSLSVPRGEEQVARELTLTLAGTLVHAASVRGLEAKPATIAASTNTPTKTVLAVAGFTPRRAGATWTWDVRRTVRLSQHVTRWRGRATQWVLDPWRKPEPSARREK